jgi:proline iminopeptidase
MTEGWIAVNDVQLWVADAGEGHPVLLCNGGPGCCDYLGPVAEMIDDMARVIRFEPRGCGQSDPTGPYDVATTLADMDAIREAMGFERWLVGGHSAGAFLALAYALEFPERVTGLLYLSGAGVQNDRQWHIAYHDALDTTGEWAPEFDFPPNLEVNRVGNESAREYCRDPYLLRRIADIEAPMLAVCGGEDIRPSWPVEQLVHLIPNAGIAMLPEAGHYLWLTHADSLRTVMRGFLRSVIATWEDEIEGSGRT